MSGTTVKSSVAKQNVLEVDIGNTRIKWRVCDGGKTILSGAFFHNDLLNYVATRHQNSHEKVNEKCAALFDSNLNVERVRLANVAGGKLESAFAEAAGIAWSLQPEAAKVLELCAGVQQGYTDKSRLGVDRWLAILAGFNSVGHACLVVNCGTAMTVDLVDDTGKHLGGYIVPGLELMRKALFANTHAVKVERFQSLSKIEPGRITEVAVENGLLLMTKGLIGESCIQLESINKHYSVIVSGGDGEHIVPLLSAKAVYNENLVMDGLAYALP